MKDIKEKVRDKNPKIRNPASRLPKELVRSAMLETKEKSRMVADKVGRETGEESPVEYAGNRIERAEQRAGKESASVAYHGGKKLAVKTYEKIKEQRQREAVIATLDSETGSGGTSGQTRTKKGRTGAGRSIKIKPEAEKTVKEAGNRTVKTAPRMVKASPVSSQKVKTQAILQKKQAFQSMRAAREAKRAAMRSVQTAKQSKKTAQATAKGIKAMAEAAAHAVKAAFAALMAGGGTVFVILILIVGIIGGAAFIGSSQSSEPLSAEVLAHTPAIQRYAREFGISEYVPVIQAIMMQESGGRGTDPMQASECPYNTQYPKTCIFEYIYFARPDSVIDKISVSAARIQAGKLLAQTKPVKADIVIGVPDSGLDAALGFSEVSGIPYGIGLVKNKYIGRTFISPGQKERIDLVRMKLSPIPSVIQGKRVVLIDDSIVRGTTSRQLVSLLREAGAKEIHLRISAPPFLHPCYYGTDIDSEENLIASHHGEKEVATLIGADSLGYLPLECLHELTGTHSYCDACFSGKYATEIPTDVRKDRFEQKLSER